MLTANPYVVESGNLSFDAKHNPGLILTQQHLPLGSEHRKERSYGFLPMGAGIGYHPLVENLNIEIFNLNAQVAALIARVDSLTQQNQTLEDRQGRDLGRVAELAAKLREQRQEYEDRIAGLAAIQGEQRQQYEKRREKDAADVLHLAAECQQKDAEIAELKEEISRKGGKLGKRRLGAP